MTNPNTNNNQLSLEQLEQVNGGLDYLVITMTNINKSKKDDRWIPIESIHQGIHKG